MTLGPYSRSCRTASIRSGIAGGLAGELVSPFQLHADSSPGTQRYAMPKNDVLSGNESEAIALRHGSNEERHFRQRELRADADARTAAERQIREARSGRTALPRKPFRIEAIGIVPQCTMAVHHPGQNGNFGPFRDVATADLIFRARCAAREHGRRRIKPHRLVD